MAHARRVNTALFGSLPARALARETKGLHLDDRSGRSLTTPLRQLPNSGEARSKNIAVALEALALKDPFHVVSVSILFLAEVASRESPTVRSAETLNEPTEQALYRTNGFHALRVSDRRRLRPTHPMKVTQQDRSPKEGPTYGLPARDRSHVSQGSPLIGRLMPAHRVPQHLQGGLGSGITLCHQLGSITGQTLQLLIVYVHLLTSIELPARARMGQGLPCPGR